MRSEFAESEREQKLLWSWQWLRHSPDHPLLGARPCPSRFRVGPWLIVGTLGLRRSGSGRSQVKLGLGLVPLSGLDPERGQLVGSSPGRARLVRVLRRSETTSEFFVRGSPQTVGIVPWELPVPFRPIPMTSHNPERKHRGSLRFAGY